MWAYGITETLFDHYFWRKSKVFNEIKRCFIFFKLFKQVFLFFMKWQNTVYVIIGRLLCPYIVQFYLASLRSEIFLRSLTLSSKLSSNLNTGSTVCLHPFVSLNNERNCRKISEDKIPICEKSAGLQNGNSLSLNLAC